MNEKIATQLAQMDKLVFDLRMCVTALQSELLQSATYSTKVPIDQYNTALFEASPQSRESETEPKYTGEAVLTDPDGFHGKSYKDYERSLEHKRVLPE